MPEVVITITASSVVPDSNTGHNEYGFGEAISAGDVVCADPSDPRKVLKAKNDDEDLYVPIGMALTSGAAGQVGLVAPNGATITVGSVLTGCGHHFVLSGTAGKMMEESELTTDKYVSRIGYSLSATQLKLDIKSTGLQYDHSGP